MVYASPEISVAELEVAHSIAAERALAVVRDEQVTDHDRVREVCNYFLLTTMLGDAHKQPGTTIAVGKEKLGPEQDEDLFAYGLIQVGGNYEAVMNLTEYVYGDGFVHRWSWGLHHVEAEDRVPGVVLRGHTKSLEPARFILSMFEQQPGPIETARAKAA